MIRKVFKYLEPIWCSDDNKPSIRRVLSLFFSIVFLIEVLKTNVHTDVLWVIGTLVCAMLSLTTFQNMNQASVDANVEKVNKVFDNVEEVTEKISEKVKEKLDK